MIRTKNATKVLDDLKTKGPATYKELRIRVYSELAPISSAETRKWLRKLWEEGQVEFKDGKWVAVQGDVMGASRP